ncbi:RNA 2',3'-cyclic phosphodiesterase [Peterkaempfera bronchialis]|uniref:RNA 2',3'-cyclic phosphodiesterase n=1 Tax=Peterkaempfera bronchialis TaxID=2126346 RepID=UPI003C2B0114
MRLFVAVVPPPAALAELAAVLRPLRARPDAQPLRWTPAETWHLTLTFLGEVDADALPELERRLARAARRHEAHRLRFAGGGRFGGRALWAGVHGDTLALRRLAESVQAAARRTGLEVDDDRPYRAHLTLARSGVPRGGDRRAGPDLRGLKAALDDFEGLEWEVAEVRLVQSLLGGGPARYTVLGSWPLGRPVAGPDSAPE